MVTNITKRTKCIIILFLIYILAPNMLIPVSIQANAQPPVQLVPFSTNETTVSEGTAISSDL